MGKRCCRCGGSCCGCCCSKRGATVCFSLVGLALAAAVIVPPVYIYAATEDRNFGLLFPILELSKDALEHVRVPSLERRAGTGYLLLGLSHFKPWTPFKSMFSSFHEISKIKGSNG